MPTAYRCFMGHVVGGTLRDRCDRLRVAELLTASPSWVESLGGKLLIRS